MQVEFRSRVTLHGLLAGVYIYIYNAMYLGVFNRKKWERECIWKHQTLETKTGMRTRRE